MTLLVACTWTNDPQSLLLNSLLLKVIVRCHSCSVQILRQCELSLK